MSGWTVVFAGRWTRRHKTSYGSALVALGLVALVVDGGSWGGRRAWGQAVLPVDVSTQPEQGRTVPPTVTPVPVTPPPAAPAPAAAPAGAAVDPAAQTPPQVAPMTPLPPIPSVPPPTPALPETTPSAPSPGPISQGMPPMPATQPGVAAATTAPAFNEGKAYPATAIKVDYKNAHPSQPPIAQLMDTPITLGVMDGGYIAPRAGVPTVTVKLSELGKDGVQKIYRSGISALYTHIVLFFNARSIIGVFVVVDANDIDSNDNDIRPADRTSLQFIVVTSIVKQLRTVAIGENATDASRVDNPRYASILNNSPLKPAPQSPATSTAPSADTAPPAPSGPRMDLLRKDILDDYVFRLNRQPGRRVDVAVSGTNEPGGIDLDYLISESRPWYVYLQLSNTGTKETSDWRERFGFVDNQLTGHDDVFSLEYMTAGFSASHAVIGSYELPFFDLDRVRYRVYGSWNEFTASDVGQNNAQFTGDQWLVGNELIWNVFQHRELFVDLIGGVRLAGIETNNVISGTSGKGNYVEPYIGVRLDRETDLATTTGSMTLIGYTTDDSLSSIDGLGRTSATRNPVVLQFDFGQSFFIEPFLDAQRFASGSSTLAHEISISMHGQYAFHDRLFPQAQDVAGGFFSVRGYPESIVAGDSVLVGSAEYRFHVPRILPVQADPTKTPLFWDKNFRLAPQQAYGRPDWDLILRAFVDVGEVVNSNRQTFETDSTLVGTGIGAELQIKQNLNLRVDWGWALTGIPNEVTAGTNRFHLSTTLLY